MEAGRGEVRRARGGSGAESCCAFRASFQRRLLLVAFVSVHSSRGQVSGLGGRKPPATSTSSPNALGGSLYFYTDSAQAGLPRGLGFHLLKPRGERSGQGLLLDLSFMAPCTCLCQSGERGAPTSTHQC